MQASRLLKTTSIFGAGIAGEYLGRTMAGQQAKEILNRELPSTSKLRELMDAKEYIFRIALISDHQDLNFSKSRLSIIGEDMKPC
jgi:hypothetical protein